MQKLDENKRKRQMLKVAIVGNIASGKSTVEKILEEKGFKVYDTDKIAHEILESSEDVFKEFGTNNRPEIAKIVFSAPDKLRKLEEIIHPLVKEKLLKIFENNFDLVFVSVPQLFEAGFENLFDKIIYITADESTRRERLMKRNSLSPEEAQKRIEAQKEDNKKERADFIIENNDSLDKLREQIQETLKQIV